MNTVLLWGAFTAGVIHTIAGPDHYVPFIALAKSRDWSIPKTIFWTILCGLGHIASAVVIAFGMLYLGEWITESRVANLESMRGDVAAWMMMGVGGAYALWGLKTALRNRPHTHTHAHDGGTMHTHQHTHAATGHHHWHDRPKNGALLPWIIFIIFAFGPCEALLPLVMAAVAGGLPLLIAVTTVFTIATIGTMLVAVMLGYFGLSKLRFAFIERYAHTLAGATIMICGVLIYFVGL